MIRLVLFDLDGVVRTFDKSRVPAIEDRFGLAPDSLRHEAFVHPRGHAAVTGRLSRRAWIEEVGVAVGSLEAAKAWLDNWGTMDREMLDLVADVRAASAPVGLLTNGTDTIPDELAHHGVGDAFDHVFCTAFMGVAKPDPAAFRHVTDALALEPAHVFFTDDAAANVDAASAVGFDAVLYEGVAGIRRKLSERGIGVPR